MSDDPRPTKAACPRCSADINPHPSTSRIPRHRERNEKGAAKCSFSGDYLPGYAPERPLRDRSARRLSVVMA